MAEYRIRKGGREFTATRLETLKELLRRELLQSADPVSVDGDDFVTIGDIPELQPLIHELALAGEERAEDEGSDRESEEFRLPGDSPGSGADPWRHWSNFEMDEESEESSEDGVLASFLDQIDVTESGTFSVLRRSHPKVAAVSRRSQPKVPAIGAKGQGKQIKDLRAQESPPPETPQVLEDAPHVVKADRLDPIEVTADDLESIESLPPDVSVPVVEDSAEPSLSASVEPPPPTPAEPPPPVPAEPAPPDQGDPSLRRTVEALLTPVPESADSASPTDLPVSFRDWLEQKDGTGEGEGLKRFGRYDDGIVQRTRSLDGEFNWSRVLILLLVGLTVIVGYYLYVRTAALDTFLPESEVERSLPGARGLQKPSTELESVDTPVGSLPLQLDPAETDRLAVVKAARQGVRKDFIEFTSSEALEDLMFQELQNAKTQPRNVTVDPLTEKGTQDKDNRRPTSANLKIELGPIKIEPGATSEGGDSGIEELERRLIVTGLIVGKYMTQGRVRFEDVGIEIPPPVAWTGSSSKYKGTDLAAFWEGTRDSGVLFPTEP